MSYDNSKSSSTPVIDLRTFTATSKTDIKSLGFTSASTFHDYFISHPLSSGPRITKTISNPSALLVNAGKEKYRCREVNTQSAGPGSKFHAMAISILRVRHNASFDRLRKLVDSISMGTSSRQESTRKLIHRHTALPVRNNAKYLLEGTETKL